MTYNIHIEQWPDAVIARHPELPGCKAHGNTAQEALDALQDARSDYLDVMRRDSLDVPPGDSRTQLITFEWIRDVG